MNSKDPLSYKQHRNYEELLETATELQDRMAYVGDDLYRNTCQSDSSMIAADEFHSAFNRAFHDLAEVATVMENSDVFTDMRMILGDESLDDTLATRAEELYKRTLSARDSVNDNLDQGQLQETCHLLANEIRYLAEDMLRQIQENYENPIELRQKSPYLKRQDYLAKKSIGVGIAAAVLAISATIFGVRNHSSNDDSNSTAAPTQPAEKLTASDPLPDADPPPVIEDESTKKKSADISKDKAKKKSTREEDLLEQMKQWREAKDGTGKHPWEKYRRKSKKKNP